MANEYEVLEDTCASCGSPVELVTVWTRNGVPCAASSHCGHPFRITVEQYAFMAGRGPLRVDAPVARAQ